MTNFFVVSHSDGVALYRSDVNKNIPIEAIEISENVYLQAVSSNVNSFTNGLFSYVEPVVQPLTNEEIISLRKAAYINESDPLYMEWQFDNTAESEQIWRDKVVEIKSRHPLTS